jgi:drug/metabolite transporter (DMT)-like permease
MTLKERTVDALKIIGEFIWRAFGLLLFVLGAGAGVGGLMGDSLMGILAVFGGAVLVAVGWIGYRITISGELSREDVAAGMRRAAEQVETKEKK